jgi:hypothetical protein
MGNEYSAETIDAKVYEVATGKIVGPTAETIVEKTGMLLSEVQDSLRRLCASKHLEQWEGRYLRPLTRDDWEWLEGTGRYSQG